MSTITVEGWHDDLLQGLGKGPVVTFSHGWPLNADMWDGQMLFLAQHGFRVVAHDRRGHGRSSQPSAGNDMNGYADDLAALIEALDLKDITMVGPSTGGGEVTRYIGRHGTKRVSKVVLIAAVPPRPAQVATNPEGLPIEQFDGMLNVAGNGSRAVLQGARDSVLRRQSPGGEGSQGIVDQFFLWSMQSGLKNSYESAKAVAETDFHDDLKKFDVPTLLMHGDDDQIVPIDLSSRKVGQVDQGRGETYYRACHTASPPRMRISSTATCSRSARRASGKRPERSETSVGAVFTAPASASIFFGWVVAAVYRSVASGDDAPLRAVPIT
jgi:non-heme chloroperoxidase